MMTSSKPEDCFVYIVLPGQTEFVTAGRYQRRGDDAPVGRFVYGKRYLARDNPVPIDPVELKLGSTTYQTAMLKGIFGALRDASPDAWGRRVIEKRAGKRNLSETDYLLESPEDRAGALGFGLGQEPAAPPRKYNQTMALGKLQAIADAIINDEELPQTADAEQADELMRAGTSMGGARPKAVVEDKDGLWIAKLNRNDDKWNHARIERAMLELARTCGLQTAESKLETIGDRDALLVKRFDRHKVKGGYQRARMLSGLTLLRAEELPDERWSYVLLAEVLRRISAQPKIDGPELFRRMCFNALITNSDDHPRNHAVMAVENNWKLSPAYDLLPDMPISIERRDLALECGDMGRYANAENLISQCPRFLVNTEEAKAIIDDMEQAVRTNWYETARKNGVSEKDCKTIRQAFAYEGFRLKLEKTA